MEKRGKAYLLPAIPGPALDALREHAWAEHDLPRTSEAVVDAMVGEYLKIYARGLEPELRYVRVQPITILPDHGSLGGAETSGCVAAVSGLAARALAVGEIGESPSVSPREGGAMSRESTGSRCKF